MRRLRKGMGEMKIKGRGGILGLATLLVLVFASTAVAAPPSEIYADYADNGRLDRVYSSSDLQGALNSAVIQGYGKPTQTPGFRAEVKKKLSQNVSVAGKTGGTLPFTGVDLALLTAGAFALLLMGWGFRRLGRARS
jgi:hypothetical protein